MQLGVALVGLFLETANEPGLRRKVLPGLDSDAKLFWHASEYQTLKPREKTDGKGFVKKQGMVRCHDALLRHLVNVDSVSRHLPPPQHQILFFSHGLNWKSTCLLCWPAACSAEAQPRCVPDVHVVQGLSTSKSPAL